MPELSVDHRQIGKDLAAHMQAVNSAEELMSIIVGRLKERVPHFDWVGFYMLEKGSAGQEPMLVLGPFVGAPTQHTHIPLDQGICGAAVTLGHTVVVDDVRADPRYLACSVETRSEIVAPVRANGQIVGELDIDSHTVAAITPDDRALVEYAASLVGRYIEQRP